MNWSQRWRRAQISAQSSIWIVAKKWEFSDNHFNVWLWTSHNRHCWWLAQHVQAFLFVARVCRSYDCLGNTVWSLLCMIRVRPTACYTSSTTKCRSYRRWTRCQAAVRRTRRCGICARDNNINLRHRKKSAFSEYPQRNLAQEFRRRTLLDRLPVNKCEKFTPHDKFKILITSKPEVYSAINMAFSCQRFQTGSLNYRSVIWCMKKSSLSCNVLELLI